MKLLTNDEESKALEYIAMAAKVAMSATCDRAHAGCVIQKVNSNKRQLAEIFFI